MKNKVIIHIGHSKTGSSSLQKILKSNLELMKERGILYPETGLLEPKGIGQHKLAFILNEKFPGWIPSEKQIIDYSIFDDLKEEISKSNCKTIVLSSEVFSSINEKKKIQKFKNLLDDYKVQIVAYLRRPDRWLESWYAQIVKDHPFVSTPFNEFAARHKLHIFSILDNYAKVFGDECVSVFNYENILSEHGSIIKHFSRLIDFNQLGDVEFENTNVTPSRDLIEVLRKMNEFLDLPTDVHRRLNVLLVNELGTQIKNTNEYFSAEERIRIKEKYLIQIKKLNSSLFNGREEEFIGQVIGIDD